MVSGVIQLKVVVRLKLKLRDAKACGVWGDSIDSCS
jgi:hypothetical protein